MQNPQTLPIGQNLDRFLPLSDSQIYKYTIQKGTHQLSWWFFIFGHSP